jgi:hypothetical protein
VSPFVRVTPTARNAPPRILLNAHHVDRIQQSSQDVVLILKGANAAEHLLIAEPSHVIADAIKAVGKRGQITLHEVFEERPLHATTFNLSDVRAIEQHPVGTVVRFGLDGSGRFEACENLETIEQMVDAAR